MLSKEELKEIEKLKKKHSWRVVHNLTGLSTPQGIRKAYESAKKHYSRPKIVMPKSQPVRQSSKLIKAPKIGKVMSLSDIHFPIHDKPSLDAAMAFMKDKRPDVLVLNGDIYDNWLMSTHDKEAAKLFDHGALLQEEFDIARPYLEKMCEYAGEVHYILGNHENRLQRFINKNPAIFALRQMQWKRLAELPEKIKVHDAGTQLFVGNLCFTHGDRAGKYGPPKHACNHFLSNYTTRNYIFGHTHRIESLARTIYNEHGKPETYIAINQGHLSDVSKQGYTWQPNWAHGFMYAETFETNRHRFNAFPITIMGGEFSYGGKLYKG